MLHVLDDDDRTRRANTLLAHLTVWVLLLSFAAVAIVLVLLDAPAWIAPSGVGLTLIAWLARFVRKRRLGDDGAQDPITTAQNDQSEGASDAE